MLGHLRVANLGILADAAIEPSTGFTVITGETGAGKTLLLGGLRLILGGKASTDLVGPHGDISQVDGLFFDEDGEVGASRVVPREGRSRAHLDGTIVAATTLEERLGGLVEIVGQHDQLALTRPSYLLELLDGTLDGKGRQVRGAYRSSWSALQEAVTRQQTLGGDLMALTRELDLARYQATEIAGAGLEPGLDDRVEADVSRLRNLEEIREHLAETVRITESVADQTGELVSRLRKASGLDPTLSSLATDAEGLAATVSEVSRASMTAAETLDLDASGLEELESRLTTIGDLKRKYGRTLDEVLTFGREAAKRADELEALLEEADQIEAVVASAQAEVRGRAAALHKARGNAAVMIVDQVRSHLGDLALASARVTVEVQDVEPGPGGADRVVIEFASDDRLQPGHIAAVASGGELSRLVLALRLATKTPGTATLVFDEVDTGIGGKTALAMGAKLAELASSSQVLCVTHLPQVAAHADTHYVVERGADGSAGVRRIEGDERVEEITRMLAGLPDSEAGRIAASELLAAVR